jgi:hypothetical protein
VYLPFWAPVGGVSSRLIVLGRIHSIPEIRFTKLNGEVLWLAAGRIDVPL